MDLWKDMQGKDGCSQLGQIGNKCQTVRDDYEDYDTFTQ